MSNELIFFIQAVLALGSILIALRFGREWVMGMIVVNVILMNIFVIKEMDVFGLEATAGNILYASIFLGTDILDEYFGKKEARKAVSLGFFASLFFVVMSQLILKYTPNEFDFAQTSLATVFSFIPRIVLASLIAYLISQHLDVWIYSTLKRKTKGKYLWLRNNASTWTAQLIDSFLFTMIAFFGVFPNLFKLFLFTYLIKIVIAVIDTPFLYLSKHIVKKEYLPDYFKKKT